MAEIKKLDSKQAAIVVAIIIALAIFMWFMFGSGGSKKAARGMPSTAIAGMSSNGGSAAPPPPPPPPKAVTVTTAPEILEQETAIQREYLNGISELESLKIEQQIQETTRAIKQAQLQIAQTDKQLKDINQPPSLSWNAYASGLAGERGAAPPQQTQQATTAAAPPPILETAYVLISVSMEGERWNAVVGVQGRLYTVGVGDTLVTDGSVVRSIDKDGIILEKAGRKRRIAITTSI